MEKTIDSVFNIFEADVKTSFPSIFTQEDVLSLLKDFKQQISDIHQEESVVGKIKEDVLSLIENYDYEDDIDVSLGCGWRLEIEFNTRSIVRDIERVFKDHLEGNK